MLIQIWGVVLLGYWCSDIATDWGSNRAQMSPLSTYLYLLLYAYVTVGYLMFMKWLTITVHPTGKQWRYMYKIKSFGIAAKQINKYWYQHQSLLLLGDIREGIYP